MLKLFDKNHNAIGHLVKYKDCKKESDVSTGDATLSFTYLEKSNHLETEMYIQTREDEYVIKEVSESSDGFPQIVAALNLEDLEAKPWQEFSVTDATIDEAAMVAFAGTGWTTGKCNVTKRRNAGMVQMTSLGVIQNLCTAFMCEVVFDTIGKKVSFCEKRGEDKGVYFLAGLNLKKLQKKSSSYDFYTRIIPIGADGLTIEEANGGKDYLENHQYSDKIKTYIWQDESYTDAQALKEDAELKLKDLSKPEKSFSAQVRDLARQKPEYSVLSYRLGDTIKIIDPGTGTMEDQRIVRMTEYEDDPEKNTCEIANTFLTFEEMQQKLRDAAAIVNHTISSDGKIKVSDILKFEQGIADSPIVSDMAGNITTMQGDLAAVKTTIGQIETNYLKADEASIKYATIENLSAVNETVHSIQGDYADFKTLTAQEIAATNARIDNINAGTVTTEYLKANYASIDFANVQTASVGELLARTGVLTDMTVVDGYVTGQLNGVRINADVITAGTLSVDRLMVTGEDSIVYQINVASSGLSMAELEDEKYQKYLNGTDIVAASITGDRIAGNTITGNHIIANSIHGDRILAGSITAREIDVHDLFAHNILSRGSIIVEDTTSNTVEDPTSTHYAYDEFAKDLDELFSTFDMVLLDQEEGYTSYYTKTGNRFRFSIADLVVENGYGIPILTLKYPFTCIDAVGIGDIDVVNDIGISEHYAIASFKYKYNFGIADWGAFENRLVIKREKVLSNFKMGYDGSIFSTGGQIGGLNITEDGLKGDHVTIYSGEQGEFGGYIEISSPRHSQIVKSRYDGNGLTVAKCGCLLSESYTNSADGTNDNWTKTVLKLGKYEDTNPDTPVTTITMDGGTGDISTSGGISATGRIWAEGGISATGSVIATKGLGLTTVGGTWISGKTATNCIYSSTQQANGIYYPMMRINTASGHVWNIGGIGDKVGMYGYHQSLTGNGTTWNTEWDVGTGNITHSHNMTISGSLTVGGSSYLGKIYGGSIELSEPYPYIDFHFNNSTADYTSRIWESSSGNININGVDFNSSTIFSANWFRSKGNTGWYNQEHGGGWYMLDSTWIRTYNQKSIYQDVGIMRTDGTLQVGSNGAYFNANSAGASFGVDLTMGSHNIVFNNTYGIRSGGHWLIRRYVTSADNTTQCTGVGSTGVTLRLFTANSRVWLHNTTTTYFATTSTSDRRLKKDLSEITEAYEQMYMDVDTFAFRYILDDDTIHYGFMAQDVEKALKKYRLTDDSNLYGVYTAENAEAAVIHDTNVYHVNYLEWVPLNKHMITKTIRRLDMLEADTETKFNMLSAKTDSTEHRLAEVTEELARMQAENQVIKTELEQLKQQRASAA